MWCWSRHQHPRSVRSFRVTYRLILREKELHCHVQVVNPSRERELCFQLLLHTYLKVPDVTRCQVTGLRGCHFTDTVRANGWLRSLL